MRQQEVLRRARQREGARGGQEERGEVLSRHRRLGILQGGHSIDRKI